MPPYRLAIWDWNGTLQNDAAHIYDCVRRIFRHFAIPCPSFETYRGETSNNYMEFYQRHGIPPHITKDELNGIFRNEIEERRTRPRLFPDTRHALLETAGMVEKQHLVSGCPEDILSEELTSHNIAHFFSRIIGDACDKTTIFRQLMEEHRVRGEETLIIGDCSHDAFAAKAAGAHAILCTRGFHSREYLTSMGNTLEGTIIVESLREIPLLLQKLTPARHSRKLPSATPPS